jgi:hypothetical protein
MAGLMLALLGPEAHINPSLDGRLLSDIVTELRTICSRPEADIGAALRPTGGGLPAFRPARPDTDAYPRETSG